MNIKRKEQKTLSLYDFLLRSSQRYFSMSELLAVVLNIHPNREDWSGIYILFI